MNKIIKIIIILLLVPLPSFGAVIIDDNMDSYTTLFEMTDGTNVWSERDYLQSGEAALETTGCRSGKCVSVTYDVGDNACDTLEIPLNSRVFHIRFSFKFTGGDFHSKFIKAFDGGGADYANTTANSGSYTGRIISGFSSGAGTPGENDTTSAYAFTRAVGYSPTDTGTITISQEASFAPDLDTWHTFEAYVVRNTDGNSDGLIRVWIDAVDSSDIYFEVQNWKMRPDAAPANWSYIHLSEYAMGQTSQIIDWFDDVKVTDDATYIGPADAGVADTTAPTAAIIQSDPQAITANSLTITGTCTGDGDEAGAKIRVGSAPDATNGTACTGTADVSCDASGLFSVGANTLYLSCYDEVPNYSASPATITVNYTQDSLIGSPSGSFTIH